MPEPRPAHRPEVLALARWTVLLMGWVWLGAQGQRLGWSVASGLLPVALWWSLRLAFAHTALGVRLPPAATPVLGAITALGVLIVGQLQPPAHGHAALMGVAAVWAAWSARLEAAPASGRCGRRWQGWPPLVAAALTALGATDMLPSVTGPWAATLVLLLAAALGGTSKHRATHRVSSTAGSALPATAMGLMMGTLWLNNAWCSAAGWTPTAMVAWHLGLMAALPALTRLGPIPRPLPAPWAERLPLALLALGALALLAGSGAVNGLAGMGLLALAWSVHAGRHRPGQPGGVSGLWSLGGPMLLLAVGWLSPTQGPLAQQVAYGLLGVLSLIALAAPRLAGAPRPRVTAIASGP